MRKIIKKYGLTASICMLLCCSVGAVCTAWAQPTITTANADEAVATAPTLAIKEEKGIRVADDGHNGIRFTATISDYSYLYEYHMVIVPADYTTAAKGYANSGDVVGDLNAVIAKINADKGKNIQLNDQICTPAQVGEEDIIQASITNIIYNNSIRDFVAVAYAKTAEMTESKNYIYSEISSPVNVTELSAELLDAGVGEADAALGRVVNDYVDTGIKKAAGLAASDEVPALSVEASDMAIESGKSADVKYAIKNGEKTVNGLDFLVKGVSGTAEVAGISYENGKVSVADTVLTRTATATVTSIGNKLTSSEFVINVNQPEKNIFAPVYMQSDFGYGWTPLDAQNALTRAYDETEGAMKVTMIGSNTTLTARSYILFLTLDEIKYQISQGNNNLTFEVKGDEGTAICIYNKVRSTTNNKGNEYMDDGNLGGASTAKIYRNVTLGGAEYVTVSVNLTDFMALNENGEFISILVQGTAGANVYFKNASFGKVSNNVFSDEYTWSLINTDVLGVSYDYSEQAVNVSKKNTSTNIAGRDYVAYLPVAKLKEVYESGQKGMSFYAKATTDDVQLRIYAKNTSARDGDSGIVNNATYKIGVYGEFALTTEYTEYTIDLEKFFTSDYITYAETNYIGIVFAGPSQSEVYFKNATYTDEYVAPAIDYTKVNVFSNANYANWVLQSSGNVAKEFDATDSAVKVTAKSYEDKDNQFTSKERRIYLNSIFREAYEAGYTKFTFEYKSALTGGTNYGFRIYANDSTLSVAANMTTQLKQVSGADLVSGTWTKVEVDLSAFGTDANLFGLSIVVIGNVDTSIMFGNGSFAK